jgi:hypothetical protein
VSMRLIKNWFVVTNTLVYYIMAFTTVKKKNSERKKQVHRERERERNTQKEKYTERNK